MGTLTLLFAVAAAAFSPEAAPLTLSEAVSLSAGEAPAVAQARAVADVAFSRQKAAKAGLFPSLSLDAGFLSSDDPVDAFGLALKQQRFSLSEFAASDPNHPGFARDWSAGVSAAWSVDLFGSARAQESGAKSAAEAADRVALRTRDVAVFQAIAAFAAARRAEEVLALLATRRADAEKDVLLARSLYEQGLTTAADPAGPKPRSSRSRRTRQLKKPPVRPRGQSWPR